MQKLVFVLVTILVALFFAVGAEAAPYAQLSSSQNQLGVATPQVVKLNQNDAVKGITNSNGLITFKEAGAYFVMAAGQVGSADGKGQGSVRLWMRKNGQDIENSNTEQTILPGFTTVLVSQGIGEMKAGDTIQMVFSVSPAAKKLGLIASTPAGEPMVPSIIFTAFKADEGAFAQVSSTETQMAGAKGRLITLNSNDAMKNFENNAGVLTCKTAGSYFVMAAGQVGCAAKSEKGRVRLWLRQNGQDLKNSNSEQTVSPGFTAVLVTQGVMACKAGDRLEFIQSASGAGMGLVASAPVGEATVPSIIVSVVKVAGAYAQLSSVETQVGASYGQMVRLNQTDAARKVENSRSLSTSLSKGNIAIDQDGIYLMIAAGQVGGAQSKGFGSLRLWLRKGGFDIAKSNTEQTVLSNFTAVLVSQGVGEIKQGDRVQLYFSARGAGVGLIATEAKGEPAVPSMIFTLVKVD